MNTPESGGFLLSGNARAELERMRDDLPEGRYQELLGLLEEMGSFEAYDEELATQLLNDAVGTKVFDFFADPEYERTIDTSGGKRTIPMPGLNTLVFDTYASVCIETPFWAPLVRDQYDIEAMKGFLAGCTLAGFQLSNMRISVVLSKDAKQIVVEGNMLSVFQELAEDYEKAGIKSIS